MNPHSRNLYQEQKEVIQMGNKKSSDTLQMEVMLKVADLLFSKELINSQEKQELKKLIHEKQGGDSHVRYIA